MRKLNTIELNMINGGLTNLEIFLGSGFFGTGIGAIAGGVMGAGPAGTHAISMVFGSVIGIAAGGAIGCAVGVLSATAYIGGYAAYTAVYG